MTEQPPQHETISPEEAGSLIKQNGESELLSAEEIASSLRDHVEEYGPSEVEIGGVVYTVDIDRDPGDEPEGDDPDLLVRFMERLFEREPGLRQHFVGLVVEELCEEIARREDPKHAHATVRLIEEIEHSWKEQS